jgi:hypothetical protein
MSLSIRPESGCRPAEQATRGRDRHRGHFWWSRRRRNAYGVRISAQHRNVCRYRNYLTQSDYSGLEEANATMRAIPTRQRVRTGLVQGAAVVAVLITAVACTSATAHTSPTSSSSHGSGGNAARSGDLTVSTADGAVRGKTVAATDEFLGIRYAAPPVGPLRWRPPQPPDTKTGSRRARGSSRRRSRRLEA